MIFKISILIFICLVLIFMVIFIKNHRTVKPIKIDIVLAENIITFFKRPDIRKKLIENKNLIAIAIAIKRHNKKIITLACFDKKLNTIDSEFISYEYKKMDQDLLKMFGDKDMIIFK